MEPQEIKLSWDESKRLSERIAAEWGEGWEHERKRSCLVLHEGQQKLFEFKYPIAFPAVLCGWPQFAAALPDARQKALCLMIQAGSAAMAFFEDGEMTRHKVIKSYMVRKKQGKSQLTYLSQKGKSKAGSRVRLHNTVHFFESINEKIKEWEVAAEAEVVLFSAPIPLWNLVFESKEPAAFEKDDPRLRKIPLDLDVPCFEELERVLRFSDKGFIKFFSENAPAYLKEASINPPFPPNSADGWTF